MKNECEQKSKKKKEKGKWKKMSAFIIGTYASTSSWESVIKQIIWEPISFDCTAAFRTYRLIILEPVETTSFNSLKSHRHLIRKESNGRVLFMYSCTVFKGHGNEGEKAWK